MHRRAPPQPTPQKSALRQSRRGGLARSETSTVADAAIQSPTEDGRSTQSAALWRTGLFRASDHLGLDGSVTPLSHGRRAQEEDEGSPEAGKNSGGGAALTALLHNSATQPAIPARATARMCVDRPNDSERIVGRSATGQPPTRTMPRPWTNATYVRSSTRSPAGRSR